MLVNAEMLFVPAATRFVKVCGISDKPVVRNFNIIPMYILKSRFIAVGLGKCKFPVVIK